MGISLAVGRLTLDQVAEVRILHPQPTYQGDWGSTMIGGILILFVVGVPFGVVVLAFLSWLLGFAGSLITLTWSPEDLKAMESYLEFGRMLHFWTPIIGALASLFGLWVWIAQRR